MGLLGTAGVALGVPVVRVGLWWNRRPADGLEALSQREFQIAEALVEAIVPPGGTPPESGKELNLAMFLDAQIAAMNEDLQRVIKAGLHAVEDMSMFEDWGITPFSRRTLEERQAIVVDWDLSSAFPKRALLRVLKWYTCMGLCELPGMLDTLGVDYLCS